MGKLLNMSDKLPYGKSLALGQKLTSENGIYDFIFQADGNLVLYKTIPNGSRTSLWSSHTFGKGGTICTMQEDGNLVIYTGSGKALWSSNTFHDQWSFLFVQNDGNAVIYHSNKKQIWSTGTKQPGVIWHGWESVSEYTGQKDYEISSIRSKVGAVAVENGVTDLYFFCSTKDYPSLFQTYYTNGQWHWGWPKVDFESYPWLENKPRDVSPVVISANANHRALFFRYESGGVFHKHWDGKWHNLEDLGGAIKGDVGAVYVQGGVIDLYARWKDDALYQKFWVNNKWSDWHLVDNSLKLASSPTVVSANPQHRAVFAKGENGNVYHKYWDGQWHPWENLGGQILGEVGAVYVKGGVIDLYVCGTDHALYQNYWVNNKWSGWFLLDNKLSLGSSPSVISFHEHHRAVFALDNGGKIRQKSWI